MGRCTMERIRGRVVIAAALFYMLRKLQVHRRTALFCPRQDEELVINHYNIFQLNHQPLLNEPLVHATSDQGPDTSH